MDLSISIVTHNSARMIYQCLESILNCEYPFAYEVFVVDNCSLDETAADLQQRFPQVQLVRNTRNVGYARANNQAIRRSRGEYILIVNPDIVVRQGTLEKMLDYMKSHPEAGVAGCQLFYPSGELQLSCRRFPTLTTFLLRGSRIGDLFPHIPFLEQYLLQNEDHCRDLDVDWCLGSCLLIRRKALDEAGLLDERFFLYYEDIDLCFRIKQKGWKVAYVAGAEMVHHYHRLSASLLPNRYTVHHLKSALYFFWKFRQERKRGTII